MKYLLLGILMAMFLVGCGGGFTCLVIAIVTWHAPWVGLGLALFIVGLSAGLGATYF